MEATPDVFHYLDYRKFLSDYYTFCKARGLGFSYRSFARRAGVGAPNYLKLVIEGKRGLSSQMTSRFSKACRLEGESMLYFQDLVAFNQASTSRERQVCYQRLTSFRKYRQVQRLDIAHAAYHSKWYVPVVHELSLRKDFQSDPNWIAKKVRPRITVRQSKQALLTLLELGMLERTLDGSLKRAAHRLVSTGPETQGVHIANYHRMMLQRAEAAMDLFPAEERDISSLTMCLGPNGLAEVKRRVQEFRQELLDLSSHEDNPTQVLQLNLQLFPVSEL